MYNVHVYYNKKEIKAWCWRKLIGNTKYGNFNTNHESLDSKNPNLITFNAQNLMLSEIQKLYTGKATIICMRNFWEVCKSIAVANISRWN